MLYAAAFGRALATGLVGVMLGLYLARLQFALPEVGFIVAAGLSGAAVAALGATLAADRVGRRRFLIGVSLLGAVGACFAALVSDVAGAALAAFVGMLNGMGRDRGAALIVEQAILPATTTDADRTSVFARYNVLQDVGHAFGSLLAVLPALLRSCCGMADLPSFRVAMGVYALLALAPVALYLRLSTKIEQPRGTREARVPLAPESRRILWKIGSLFAFDSLAGGLFSTALLSLFFYQRFGVDERAIAPLFFAARVANAFSHLGAAWLAKRIGLVNTMVFTHIPSSLFMVTVAFAPSFPVAAVLFLLREGLVEMDVPTRQSYVMAVVRPAERTFASGTTNLVRMAAWAVAPTLAGVFMGFAPAVPLCLGAGMKVTYDLLLYRAFRHVRPPEER